MSAANPPGAFDTDAEGPDRWCYDALEPRTWSCGDSELSLKHSLKLIWIHFDGVSFARLVDGEQDLVDFLVGPPAAETPLAVLDEVRAYIRGARTPGRSTWLALEIVAPHPPFYGAWLQIDGGAPDNCIPPGPAVAGLHGAASLSRRGTRAL